MSVNKIIDSHPTKFTYLSLYNVTLLQLLVSYLSATFLIIHNKPINYVADIIKTAVRGKQKRSSEK